MGIPVKRGIYIVPSLFTLANLAAGTVAVLFSANDHLTMAAWAIIAGIVMDMMDGRLARWAGATSQFGTELDSLCDLVTFGVAPAVLMFELALEPLGRPGYAIAIFFVVAAALRLARFNLRAQSGESTPYFMGLPVPAAAGILASFVMSYELFDADGITVKTIPLLMQRMPTFFRAVPVVMILLSILMISTVRYGNFKQLKLGRPHSLQMVGLVLVALLLIFTYPQNMIFVVFSLYVLSGLMALAWRSYSAQRAKRLSGLKRRSTDRNEDDTRI
jgi:CDP-diacylglycerol---serine O-phosphatidyltransferase